MIDFSKSAVFKLTLDKKLDLGLVKDILVAGEEAYQTYTTVRDKVIFTNKRVIAISQEGNRNLNVQIYKKDLGHIALGLSMSTYLPVPANRFTPYPSLPQQHRHLPTPAPAFHESHKPADRRT